MNPTNITSSQSPRKFLNSRRHPILPHLDTKSTKTKKQQTQPSPPKIRISSANRHPFYRRCGGGKLEIMSTPWKRAAAAIKDKNSLFLAHISRRSSRHNPDLEAAVVKATSHDEHKIDYRNAQRVFSWIRTSPLSLRPLMFALSRRLDKTRSWVVAVKGLMLMHGIVSCRDAPAAQNIGRLPFDLTGFTDGHSRMRKTWGFNEFIRVYYKFLDQRSTLICHYQSAAEQKKDEKTKSLQLQVERLKKFQSLLDNLLEIKPKAHNMRVSLILEAMDCVMVEIYDVYSRICSGIAKVLLRIHEAKKPEAEMALVIVQKAMKQGEKLADYFEFCKDFGVLNANECPEVTQISEEDILELEQIINGVSSKINSTQSNTDSNLTAKTDVSKAEIKKESKAAMETVVTDNWVIFEEDHVKQMDGAVVCLSNQKKGSSGGVDDRLPLISIDNHMVTAATCNNNNQPQIMDLIKL